MLKMFHFLILSLIGIAGIGRGASAAIEDYPLVKAPLLTQVLVRIKNDYLEPNRIDPAAMFEASLNTIQQTVPEVLSQCQQPTFCTVTVHQAMRRFSIPQKNLLELRTELIHVFRFIDLHADKDTDRAEIEYAAINGLLNELDPHSGFMDPDFYREFSVNTEGEFGGLGIVISLKEAQLTVMSPLEGTPAWRAGIKPGDKIVQIDEESTINMALTEAVGKLRGPVDSQVSMKILREGNKTPLTFKMKRAIINIEAVKSKLVQTPSGKKVAFLRINSFQGNTMRDFYVQLDRLMEEDVAGIILDLRNNPGGLLKSSIQLSDTFLKEGTIVSTVGRNGTLLEREKAEYQGLEGDWPLIVLVNEGSASASEIVVGALKNNNRALVLGHRTFGKGSVQTVHTLPLDKNKTAALKLTIAQYLIPGNQSIQSVGVVPDIELVPVLVDSEQLDVIPNIIKREADAEKHLNNASTIEERPAFQISYLEPKFVEIDATRYDTGINLAKDTMANIALVLLDDIKSSDRPTMLQEIIPALAKQQALENRKIQAEFKKLNIAWTFEKETKQEAPQAKVDFQLLKEGKPIVKAIAGEEVTLEVGVTNIGKGPFHRLAAQSDSKSPLFQNIEFAFGSVKPNETKKWKTKMKIPKSLVSESGELTLQFQESNNHQPMNIPLVLPIVGHSRPRFSHLFRLEKDWAQKLKKGKSVQMTFEITNLGPGSSELPSATIKNLSGSTVFIEKGRTNLKPLKPGGKETVQFSFHLDEKPELSELSWEFSIFDADLLAGYQQKIMIDLKNKVMVPASNQTYTPPQILVENPVTISSNPEQIITGNAKDDEVLRDMYIFVEEKKVFYQANIETNDLLSFAATLPLKEGNNSISITARDNYNLTSYHYMVIQYRPATTPPTPEASLTKKGNVL